MTASPGWPSRLRQAWASDSQELLGRLLALVSAAFALVVQSGPFVIKDLALGDLAYHRGVALTMTGGNLQGEGPIAGVISYYGGLYPLLTGLAASFLGVPFDHVVSVLSWVAGPLWVGGLLFLGLRVWPGDWLASGILAFLATVCFPLTTLRTDIWVESVLPSGTAFWPVYPRDLASTLLLVAVGLALSRSSRARIVGSGVVVGLAVLFHVQVGIVAAAVTGLVLAVMAARTRTMRPVVEAVVMAAIAVVVSAWWWVPRIGPTLAGPLLLADAPDRMPFRMDVPTFAVAFGPAGVAGLLGLVAALHPRARRHIPILFVAWLLMLLPLVVVDRLAGGSPAFPERRTWLLLSLPLLGLAAALMATIVRRLPTAVAAVAIVAIFAVPSMSGALATSRYVTAIWTDRAISGRDYPAAQWDPIASELTSIVRDAGRATVLTYDTEAPWVWSLSGAQVFSLWLPGPFKLGFDPRLLTGLGFLERVRLASEAFARGRPGLCELAERERIDRLLLRSRDGLVGTFELTFAAPYRTDPLARRSTPPLRSVGRGVFYRDSGPDWLELESETPYRFELGSRAVRLLVLELRTSGEGAVTTVTIDVGGRRIRQDLAAGSGIQQIVMPVDRGGEVVVRGTRRLELLRATGFQAVPFEHPADGPFLVPPRIACQEPG